SVEREGHRPEDGNRLMGRDGNASSHSTVSGDRGCEPVVAIAVKRGARLVEQPYRRRCGDQPGESEPPPLPGREPAARPIGGTLDAKARQRGVDGGPRYVPRCCPEEKHLARRQRWLYAIEMTDVVNRGAVTRGICGDLHAGPRQPAGSRNKQPR